MPPKETTKAVTTFQDAPEMDSEKVLARVRAALLEAEGFSEGRADLIIGAIQAQGVHFIG